MPTSNLLFLDSFDHYNTSQMGRKWTGGLLGVTIVSDGRTGQGMDGGPSGSASAPFRTLPNEYPTVAGGTAYRMRVGASFVNSPIGFGNALTGLIVYLQHVGDGRFMIGFHVNEYLSWTAGGGNVLSGTEFYGPPSTVSITTNMWYYLELQVTASLGTADGTGHATLTLSANAYLNGSASAICTATQSGPVLFANYTGHATFSYLRLYGTSGGIASTFDDVYATDGEVLGDVKIAVLYPNAGGDSTAWTPSGAGANYSMVNEHIADDDTTFVSAAAGGTLDLYNLDDITGFTGTIVGAQSCICAKKSDSGGATIASELKSAGTTQGGVPWSPSNGNYIYDLDAHRTSPFTLSNWTVAEINALQLGQQRIS